MSSSRGPIRRCRHFAAAVCLLLGVAASQGRHRVATSAANQLPREAPHDAAPQQSPGLRVVPGERLEREIAGGVTHTYEIHLRAGVLASIVIDQRGVDLAATLVEPAGSSTEFDGRWHGPEPVFVRTSQEGVYRLNVRTVLKPTIAERYEIVLDAVRDASPDDERRLRAAALSTECKKLVLQATAASLQTAARNYGELFSLWESLGDRHGEAATLNSLGFAMSSLGRFDEALGHYRRSLARWRELGYERGEAETLLNIGAAHSSMGDKREALARYEQVLPISQRLQDRRGEMYVLNNIASVLGDLGEPRSAIERLGRVLELASQIGDQVAIARTLVNTSTAYQALGSFQQALGFAERALSAAPPSDLRGRAVVLTRLGDLYFRLGEHARALDSYQQAIERARAGGDPRIRAFTTLQLSVLHRHLGELDDAFAQLAQARALAEEVQDRRTLAMSLTQQGELHHRRGEPDQALASFRQALEHFETVRDPRSEALARLGIGLVHAERGDVKGAHESLSRGLPLVRAANDRYSEAQLLLAFARIERDAGDLDAARAHAERALELVEAIRGDVVSQQFRTSYADSTHAFYEVAIDVLMRLHERTPSARFDRLALEVSERGRARTLLELLTEAGADIREGVDPSLLSRERQLRERVNAKAERLLSSGATSQAASAAAALKKELEGALVDLRDIEAEMRARSPRFAALTFPQPLRASEIQAQVDAGTVVLVYSLGEIRSYVWVISPDRITSTPLPARREIEQAAQRLHDLISARVNRRSGETVAQWRSRIVEADAGYPRVVSALSNMILRPELAELEARRIIVVAEGALQYVPFAALPLPGASDGRPLLAIAEVASIPSISSIAELRRDAADRPLPSRVLAVLADPVFSADDPRVGRSGVATALSARPIGGASSLRDLERAAVDVGGPQAALRFARLPFTRREAEAVLRLAASARRLSALDFDASYATAVSGELSQYRYVHFATHGLLNALHPELSGLVFSLVDRGGRPQNGFLRAHEVYNLRLPAELVVLSGCRTGLGKDVRGEGMIGLARGFMYAGARRIAVSLWQVDDEATAELMSRFYAAMLRDGARPTAALRHAQLDLQKTRRWRAPFYWAGFVIQGEWR